MTVDEATILKLVATSPPDALLAAVAATVFNLPPYDPDPPPRPSPTSYAVRCLECSAAVWWEQGGLKGCGTVYCSPACRRRACNRRHAAQSPRAGGRFARRQRDPAPRRDGAPGWVKLDGVAPVLVQ